MICSFFLGANTPKGFYSLFDNLDSFDLSVIKGASGSGKSTLIKELINKTYRNGLCERILCASDIGSLDGAIFHTDNIAVIDGTAPHISEVRGLGKYITMPQPKDSMEQKREQLSVLKKAKETAYKNVYACLSGALQAQNCAQKLVEFDLQRLIRRTDGIISRETKQTHKKGKVHRRFIDAFTPNGTITLFETVNELADRIYVIEDRLALAAPFFRALEGRLLERGYEIFCCQSPMCPENIRHIIVPELSLAFITSDRTSTYTGDAYRHIHLTAYISKDSLRKNKTKLKLFEKLQSSLVQQACCDLESARLCHREIEMLYKPHLDIPALKALNKNISLI